MRIGTNSFRGELPRLTPRALPDDASQGAANARLLTGDVTAWNQFALEKVLAESGPVETIALMAGQYWLSFDSDVDVARGIIPGDDTFRTYLTGLDVPRFTNLAMATTGSEPYPVTTRPLGVPGPDAAPTVAAGVDPTPSTFTIDVFDEGDELATNWTIAPSQFAHGGATQVTQSPITGNPAPSYELLFDDNPGAPAYAFRNFGVASCVALRVSFDFMCTSGSNNYLQMVAGVMRTLAGEGIQITATAGALSIGTATGWITTGSSALATTAISGPSFDAWYTCTVDLVNNGDSTQTVTATLYQGSVQVGVVTATASFILGDYCGFVAETGGNDGVDRYRTFYDNILVQGNGSTGYNPQSTATSYVYTFVNDLGEESAPSFASSTVLRPDGIAITVTMPTSVPSGVSSEYGITTKRIYRAATGATGTLFLFVAEVPLAQAEYVDTIPDTELGEALESEGWDLPPDDLRGIMALPNGVMVGFRRNQLCLSAQNRPHAWPVAFRLNTDTDIVGIGNIDTTVVMGTESFVYLAGGSDPSAYSMSKLEVPQACVAKRSFAYLTGIGVVFATPDGLVAVAGSGQVRNLTETVFTRDQWQALTPETIIGVQHDDVYHFFYSNGPSIGGQGGFALDMKASGFGLVALAYHATAAYADPMSDNLYLVLDTNEEPTDDLLPVASTAPVPDGVTVYRFNGDPTSNMVYRWRSKLYVLSRPASFMKVVVKADAFTNTVVKCYKQVLTAGVWTDVLVREMVVTSEDPMPLPVGDDYTRCWWEVLSTNAIQNVQFAEDIAEFD